MVLTLQERIFIVENVLRKGGKYTKEVQELFQKNLVQNVWHIEIVFPLCWISSKKLEVFKTNPKLAAQKPLQIQSYRTLPTNCRGAHESL